MAVEVKLLGPVVLSGDGGAARPGPAKRRALLAALALTPNRPVTLSRLITLLWPGPPPVSAVSNIRNHVGALRETLGGRLVSQRGAYRLMLAPGELDVAEFERLAEAGRRCLAEGDPVRAEAHLVAALRQWRGPAGGGIGRDTELGARFAALDDRRLRVIEMLDGVRGALSRSRQRAPAVPRELPPVPVLPGRSAELAAVLAAARPPAGDHTPPAVVVYGPAAGGKSALVVRAGHRLAEAFPDGQILLTGAGMRPDAGQLLGRVLRALGVPAAGVPETLEDRIARYRELLGERRVLVILDDAADAGQVRPLIPPQHGSALLVASREALPDLAGVPHVELRPATVAAGDDRRSSSA
jgi:hypothetical protein